MRRQKNDAADAAAICEAVGRPSMRFVPVKSAEPQGLLMLHRTRELLVSQRTGLINALRGHLAEFGIVVAQGVQNIAALLAIVADGADARLPRNARLAAGAGAGLWDERRLLRRAVFLSRLPASGAPRRTTAGMQSRNVRHVPSSSGWREGVTVLPVWRKKFSMQPGAAEIE